MALLNLHCHSTYSDGANFILELALAYKTSGHVCLCLTDHSYLLIDEEVGGSIEKWDRLCAEADDISKTLDYPIIVGLEIYVRRAEEILVFGRDACRSLLTTDALNGVKEFYNWYQTNKDPVALIMAHPSVRDHPSYFYLMMDGYETTNGGCYWGDEYAEKLKTFMPPPRRAYANQDLHALFDLGCVCNEVSEDLIIKNELDLIQYLSVAK